MSARVHVNWRAYFMEFSKLHGGNPIMYRYDKESGKGGYWLFRDGWMYARSSMMGPEMEPTSEEDRDKKSRDYWTERCLILEEELRLQKQQLLSLAEEQEKRNAPLMTVSIEVEEDDDGQRSKRRKIAPIDFNLLADSVSDVHSMVMECKRQLQSLDKSKEKKEKTTVV